MSLGAKIKEIRKEQGLSQGALARMAGVHEKLISKYENERIVPTADTLRKMALALQISADYLVFDDVPKEGKVELHDPELFERFREVENMDDEERDTIKKVIDAMIVKSKVERAVGREPWEGRMRRVLSRFRKKAEGYTEEEIMNIVGEAVKAVRDEEKRKAG